MNYPDNINYLGDTSDVRSPFWDGVEEELDEEEEE